MHRHLQPQCLNDWCLRVAVTILTHKYRGNIEVAIDSVKSRPAGVILCLCTSLTWRYILAGAWPP